MSTIIDAPVIEAAGGVVELTTPDGLVIAVIYRERYGPEWALPKGKRKPGETWQQTGLREVEEEIGLRPEITGIAGATAYLAGGVPKIVLYWRMQIGQGLAPFAPNEEVRKLAWLPLPQAIDRLSHPEEANIIRMMMRQDNALQDNAP
jgi:8-oxo-dGTP diphosphatase